MRYLLLFVVSLLLVSCAKKEIEVEKKVEVIPQWYLNPIQNDMTFLYGIGEGNSLKDATQNALENLSSRIYVTMKSNTSIKQSSYKDYREYVKSSSDVNIESKTAILDVPSYKVNHSAFINGKMAIQISVNKNELINLMKSKLDGLSQKIKHLDDYGDEFIYYIEGKKLMEELVPQLDKADILKSFNESVTYDKEVLNLKNRLSKIRTGLKFNILADNESKKYIPSIKNNLIKNGLIVVDNGEAKYKIRLESNTSSKTPYGLYIYENLLSITLLDNSNYQMASNTIPLKGGSSVNMQSARLDSVKELDLLDNILPF